MCRTGGATWGGQAMGDGATGAAGQQIGMRVVKGAAGRQRRRRRRQRQQRRCDDGRDVRACVYASREEERGREAEEEQSIGRAGVWVHPNSMSSHPSGAGRSCTPRPPTWPLT